MPVFIQAIIYRIRQNNTKYLDIIKNANEIKIKGAIIGMKCDLEQYSKIEIDEAKRKIKRIQKRLKEFKILKEKLEKQFDFEIVDYIIYDILDEETYYHTCLMINLAVLNNRLSIENGEQLKQGLKDLFKINNSNDKIDKKIYIGNYIDFDIWYEKYSTEEIIDLRKYLSKRELTILKKLNIKIKSKMYTAQEFENLDMESYSYYIDEDMTEEELKKVKQLPNGVSREEYISLLEKFCEISDKFIT